MVTALKEHVLELKGELTTCKVTLGNGMLAFELKKHRMDVLKPKEFEGTSGSYSLLDLEFKLLIVDVRRVDMSLRQDE
ncbi:hypothetical protein PVK06_027901 [Gossypium arboreum]|uniref:Uncharacterized protein n=1 Tax=Gossypium arboreum TaxID=29729 RepID=A0ABR0P474_GOSAR|nr:hypothetical protein PVK06_027901 [Gossypium arboreum]